MAETYQARASRRMHPKLRLIANCDPWVSAGKAAMVGCLAVDSALASQAPPTSATIEAADATKNQTKKPPLDLDGSFDTVQVNVFVRSTKPLSAQDGPTLDRLAMRRVSPEELENIAGDPNTIFVEPAESLKVPRPAKGNSTGIKPAARKVAAASDRHRGGAGILIGIIDVEGFDWAHPDFLDARGRTRFTSIWDQGQNPGLVPPGRAYGHVISAAEMAKAKKDARKVGVSPHDLVRQSQMVPGSHGTHVASIAAGNSGVCPNAEIAAVLVSLPESDYDRRTSFYDSTRLLDAVRYLLDLAGTRPVSINISLGTNGHAHDASSVVDRWIDALLAEPGRVVSIAAGNAGQERPEAPDDLGYMLGRIHAGGRIAAQALDRDLSWIVVGDRIKDASENEMEIWYEPQDRFSVSLRPPGGKWIGPIAPGEYLENFQLADRTLISIYNELHHPANGSNYIALYLTPFVGDDFIVGVPAGAWDIRLHGTVVRDGRFHAWIERDDPVDLGDGSHYWPSYFSEASNVDASSVSALACGHRVISVANLDEARQRAHFTSSQGPTRDGRPKPDLAAPGTDIVAANGFGDPAEPWIAMTGTSMASPYVAGIAGLMLAADPRLTAAQILGILKATAQPLPGGTYDWVNDCGFGVVAPAACVGAAAVASARSDVKRRFK